MDCDSECFMDANMLVMDQDQTRTVLWIVIFSMYMGKSCFYSVVKKLSSQYNSISGEICKLFFAGLGWESRVGIVWGLGWRGLGGVD